MNQPDPHDERPGTNTQDPAEGKRTGVHNTPRTAYPAGQVSQPGTKNDAPAEGGDSTTGAEHVPFPGGNDGTPTVPPDTYDDAIEDAVKDIHG